MAQAVSRRCLTTEARVLSQTNPGKTVVEKEALERFYSVNFHQRALYSSSSGGAWGP